MAALAFQAVVFAGMAPYRKLILVPGLPNAGCFAAGQLLATDR